MDIQENSILKKIIEIHPPKRIKCKGSDFLQTYNLYFSTKKMEDILRIRFLFSAHGIECKNVYGTFFVSEENKIIKVEMHDTTPSPAKDLFRIMDCFSSLPNITIHQEYC